MQLSTFRWDVGTYLQAMWQQWPEFSKSADFWDLKSNTMVYSYLHFGGTLVRSYIPMWQQRPEDWNLIQTRMGWRTPNVFINILHLWLVYHSTTIRWHTQPNNTAHILAIINPYTGAWVEHILYIQPQVQVLSFLITVHRQVSQTQCDSSQSWKAVAWNYAGSIYFQSIRRIIWWCKASVPKEKNY